MRNPTLQLTSDFYAPVKSFSFVYKGKIGKLINFIILNSVSHAFSCVFQIYVFAGFPIGGIPNSRQILCSIVQ